MIPNLLVVLCTLFVIQVYNLATKWPQIMTPTELCTKQIVVHQQYNTGLTKLKKRSILMIMVAHFVTVLLTGFIIYTAWPGSSLFSWHPTFMALAFMMMMFEGILMYSPLSSLVVSWPRSSKVTAHWICMLSGATFALLGLTAIMYNKYLNDKPHFKSWHGLFGLITIICFCVELLGGVCVKYSPKLLKGIKIRLVDLKMYHATAGLVLFLLTCVTFILGMFTNWYIKNVQGTQYYMSIGCVVLMSLIITNQVTSSYLPKTTNKT